MHRLHTDFGFATALQWFSSYLTERTQYVYSSNYGTKQTHFMRVIPSGSHFRAESTEAMPIKFLVHGHNIMMHPRVKPSIAVSKINISTTCQYAPKDVEL